MRDLHAGDPARVAAALERVGRGGTSQLVLAALREVFAVGDGELRRRIAAACADRLRPRESAVVLLGHPLFRVPRDRYLWYSERSYRTSEEHLLELLADFLTLRDAYGILFRGHPAALAQFAEVAHLTWRTYRLREAVPLLRMVLEAQPRHAATHFYLGQLGQDELGDLDLVRWCFDTFLRLEPRLVPDNDFFLDGWFTEMHAYEPSSIEALTRLGQIHLAQGDAHATESCFRKAIALAPRHHLAPHLQLADLLVETRQDFRAALSLHRQAEENHFQTRWIARSNDVPNPGVPKLEAWAAAHHPLTYRDTHAAPLLAARYQALGTRCYEESGDGTTALSALAHAAALCRRYRLAGLARICLKQAEIVNSHLRDRRQVRDLCLRVLEAEPGNARAQELLDQSGG